MPDGSKRNFSDENVVLKDLLTLTKTATQRLEQLLQRAKVHCQGVMCDEGRVDPIRLETHQVQAHGLAWLATYTESLRQMHNWAAALAAAGAVGAAPAGAAAQPGSGIRWSRVRTCRAQSCQGSISASVRGRS